MRSLKLFAVVAVIAALVAGPVLAQETLAPAADTSSTTEATAPAKAAPAAKKTKKAKKAKKTHAKKVRGSTEGVTIK
jgi:hypothetical protein